MPVESHHRITFLKTGRLTDTKPFLIESYGDNKVTKSLEVLPTQSRFLPLLIPESGIPFRVRI